MTNPNDPAFPSPSKWNMHGEPKMQDFPGLTKREAFAKAAMQGLHANPRVFDEIQGHEDALAQVARWAVEAADALIAALNNQPSYSAK
jgi:hypothetical protein